MSLALVGLATGLGARYPRFNADNPSQVAGSYGGVAFMIIAVLFMLTLIVLVGWPSSMYLWYEATRSCRCPTTSSSIGGALLRRRAGDEPVDLVVRHALGRAGARRDGVVAALGASANRCSVSVSG